MFNGRAITTRLLITLVLISISSARADEQPFQFSDRTKEAGLLPGVNRIKGHSAGWGDVDGDGWVDLYVGGFHTQPDSISSRFFRNDKGRFSLDPQENLRISTRPTASIFVDFDNDGDLDLYVSSMPKLKGSKLVTKLGYELRGCSLFRNEGEGQFTDISQGNGACPAAFGGRSAAAIDYDGDGLLDLLVGEEPGIGYNGSETHSSRLFRNLGNLQFEDVTQRVGIPADIPGLGVAAADVNNDGKPDLFIACGTGGNRLFLNEGNGKLREAPGTREVFAWPTSRGDDMVCGVCFGDVNGDGLLDIVIGQHYLLPWVKPVANRLYLNRGITNGVPKYEDITEAAGLVPLPLKSPHVEIQDFDNDGRPDIMTCIVKFADGKPHPVIFRNLGTTKGVPQFKADALSVNDFPTPKAKSFNRSNAFWKWLLTDRQIVYAAPCPSADYDNDGRLDLFFANWWQDWPSMLLHNETKGGNWFQVQIQCEEDVNRMGIGSRVNLYSAGNLGNKTEMIGLREIAVGFGYASGQPAIAHFGLGDTSTVDVEVILPHGEGKIVRKNVKTNQRLTIGHPEKVSRLPKHTTIWLIGDSTVASYPPQRAPVAGWGQVLHEHCRADVVIKNKAVSGTTSKSFRSRKFWEKVIVDVKPGDFMFIQFGHNDHYKEKGEHLVSTENFKKNLGRYVKEVRAKGATPILVTPMCRRIFGQDGKIKKAFGEYPTMVLEIAKETRTACLDLHEISFQEFGKLTPEETKDIFLFLAPGKFPAFPDGKRDGVHFQIDGARLLARWVVEDARRQNLPVAELFDERRTAPSDKSRSQIKGQ